MIRRLLVANRGEIARRIFHTCRELGVATVAVYSDADAGEPHATEAEIAINLPGSTPGETYLDIDAVIAAAVEAGADSVHPGYGFLAENPTFAQAVVDAGLTWIGPSPEAIRVMGSKIESKRLMEESGVPTTPGFEISPDADLIEAASELGFPVLVKASAGGGGKGMRVVTGAEGLVAAVDGARREAAGAFGDDTVFVEKYLEAPRHVEIQVFGDTHGNVVSLFERECSIQRRHQKIIEESPSTAVDSELRATMGEAAVAAAKAVDYVGAGTVEFLLQDGEFFFLEMNTRLQVEHPVTEAVTGLDLVQLQIDVANGHPLPGPALEAGMSGHAIEVRLYAEDPLNDFLPVTGRFDRFQFDPTDGLRVDAGVADGSDVSIFYDPMLAKVIAHADTREEATSILALALRSARLHGPTNNRDLLVRILESEEFISGSTDTHFLDRHDITALAAPLASEVDEAYAARAAALADQAHDRAQARVMRTIPSGFRNSPSIPQHRAYEGFHAQHHVSYEVRNRHAVFEGEDHASLGAVTPEHVEFTRGDTTRTFDIARYGPVRHADTESVPVRLVEVPRFPEPAEDEDAGSLLAPMPGKIVRVETEVGATVVEGQVLIVLEAMKMEHTIRSPVGGVVTRVSAAPGDQVEADATLVVVEEPAD